MSEAHKEENPLTTLRRAAMDILARREHSFHELTQKLEKKYPDFDKDQQILPVLSTLSEENLQSDQRFLESYIRYRRNKGFGPLKIQAELYHKGVDASLVKQALYSEENDWFALCLKALEKRFPNRHNTSQKEQQRHHRFLIQRGYTSDSIRAATHSPQTQ